MKLPHYILLLPLVACASGGVGNSTGNGSVTAEIAVTKFARPFTDASAISLDQFLYIYVADRATNTVLKLSPYGDSVRVVSGFGSDHYQFNGPVDVDARLTNTVFIADNLNHRVEQYSKELAYVSTLYTRENADANQRFGYPRAIAADDAGNIYVADGENKRVVKVRSDYTVERIIGGYAEATRADAILTNPIDLAVDEDEHLIVLDNGGASLVEFDNLGNVLGRVTLSDVADAIAASNDTVFVLMPSLSAVQLFRTSRLMEQGVWKIVRNDDADGPSFTDLAVRSGAMYLLAKQAVYSCTVRPRSKDSVAFH